jgi:hypothetical protein
MRAPSRAKGKHAGDRSRPERPPSLFLNAAEKASDATASERIVEGGREWPFRYTHVELEKITRAARLERFDPAVLDRLQEAAMHFQWMSPVNAGGIFFVSNTRRRNQLEEIIKLCGQGSAEKIEEKLCELDVDAYRLLEQSATGPRTYRLLGRVSAEEPRRLARAAKRVLERIPHSGADPARARRQFIKDLYRIFFDATGQIPGRSVHDGEQGRFTEFVRAALNPFIRLMSNPVMGCEADITVVLQELKPASPNRKKPAVTET